MRVPPETGGGMRPTGWRLPLGTALVAAVLAVLVAGQLYTVVPMVPWSAIPTLVLLAAAELIAAFHTRRRVRRAPGTEPMEPLSAARLLALARASIVFAAAAAGFFAGVALGLADRFHVPGPRADALSAGGTTVAALVLLAAGFALEYACRVPEEPDGGRS